jgi:nicotinate-nucleotide adenylyltransferase
MDTFVSPNFVEFLYGGTFDPFHDGHEAICRHILAQTEQQNSVLRIIPCSQPALKQRAQASNSDRLAMLSQWRETQPAASRILIDDIEMQNDKISYTAETVIALEEKDAQLVKRIWVLGTDAFNALSQWHQVSTLVSHLSFWVINRAGEKELNNELGLTKLANHSQLWSAAPGSFWFDQTINMSVASSAIRQHINRQPVPVPKVIADYIEKHELYTA